MLYYDYDGNDYDYQQPVCSSTIHSSACDLPMLLQLSV